MVGQVIFVDGQSFQMADATAQLFFAKKMFINKNRYLFINFSLRLVHFAAAFSFSNCRFCILLLACHPLPERKDIDPHYPSMPANV